MATKRGKGPLTAAQKSQAHRAALLKAGGGSVTAELTAAELKALQWLKDEGGYSTRDCIGKALMWAHGTAKANKAAQRAADKA